MWRPFLINPEDLYGSHLQDDSDRVLDRSHWREKSNAALRRENQAKQLFDNFLKDAADLQTFPVTKEDLTPPSVHLTDACWKSFKQYVMQAGCTTKRREATMEERTASKDRRTRKMYAISVTIPAHPSVAQEKKLKDDAAKARKKEVAAAKAKKKEDEAARIIKEKQALEVKVKQEFQMLVCSMEDSREDDVKQKPEMISSYFPSSMISEAMSAEDHHEPNLVSPILDSTTKKRKLLVEEPSITVPRQAILRFADGDRHLRLLEVTRAMEQEKLQRLEKFKKELDDVMEAKEGALCNDIAWFYERVKAKIIKLTK